MNLRIERKSRILAHNGVCAVARVLHRVDEAGPTRCRGLDGGICHMGAHPRLARLARRSTVRTSGFGPPWPGWLLMLAAYRASAGGLRLEKQNGPPGVSAWLDPAESWRARKQRFERAEAKKKRYRVRSKGGQKEEEKQPLLRMRWLRS